MNSYSALLEADRRTMTGLTGYLKECDGGSRSKAWADVTSAGVKRIQSTDVPR